MNLFNRKTLKRHIKPAPVPADHLAALDAWADMISSGRVTSISSAGFTISPGFGETSSVRVLLVSGRLSSDNAVPLAVEYLKTNIKCTPDASCSVSNSG